MLPAMRQSLPTWSNRKTTNSREEKTPFGTTTGLEIKKKMSGHKFATSYENLVTFLNILVAKLIEVI